MTNHRDVLVSLVPQRDRRQQPDRRQILRGGRRAVDVALSDPWSESADAVLWAPMALEAIRPKPSFH